MIFNIPVGSPGTHLDPQSSYLQFTIENTSSADITNLSQSAYSLIESIDVYMGSVQIASQSGFNVLASLLLDFQNSPASLNTTGGIYGCSDYAAADVDSYYNRLGVPIANTASRTVCLPLPYCLGTLAQKSIPLGSIREGLRVEIKLANYLDWGVYATAPASSPKVKDCKMQLAIVNLSDAAEQALVRSLPVIYIPSSKWHHCSTTVPASTPVAFTLPWKMASVNAIFAVFREVTVLNERNQHATVRTRAGCNDFYIRIGSHNYPQDKIRCDHGGAEARMELMKALQMVGMADAPSAVSTALYSDSAFAVGISLETFGHSDIMSDGQRLAEAACTFYASTSNTQNAIQVDFFAHADLLLEVSNGIVSYFE